MMYEQDPCMILNLRERERCFWSNDIGLNESEATEFVKRPRDISQFEVYSVDERTTDNSIFVLALSIFT